MSTAGVAILEREVRELIRRRGVDPLRDKAGIDQLVADALADHDTSGPPRSCEPTTTST